MAVIITVVVVGGRPEKKKDGKGKVIFKLKEEIWKSFKLLCKLCLWWSHWW